jgi:hypothetical protein
MAGTFRGVSTYTALLAAVLSQAKAQLLAWQQSLHKLYTAHTSTATATPASPGVEAEGPPAGLQVLADELAGVWGALGPLLGAARLMDHPDVVAAVQVGGSGRRRSCIQPVQHGIDRQAVLNAACHSNLCNHIGC